MQSRRVWLAAAVFACCGLATAADGMFVFELYPDAKDEYRWRLKDGDDILATSGQGYKAKADAKRIVDNFTKDISKYKFETYEDAKKQTRWKLLAKNGQTVGSSAKGYKTKEEAEKVIEAVKTGAKGAKVVEAAKEK